MPKNIAIFASGSGSNAERIYDYFQGDSEVNISMILCNNPEAGVIARAERLNIPLVMFDRAALKSGEVVRILQENDTDWVILAGFLWLIPKNMVEAFPNKIVNIHPALLPKFGGKGMYGMKVHEAVIANKENKSGCTVHFVDVDIDTGKILLQRKVDVSNNETPESLQKKVLKEEHQLLIEAIEKVISDSVISNKGGI